MKILYPIRQEHKRIAQVAQYRNFIFAYTYNTNNSSAALKAYEYKNTSEPLACNNIHHMGHDSDIALYAYEYKSIIYVMFILNRDVQVLQFHNNCFKLKNIFSLPYSKWQIFFTKDYIINYSLRDFIVYSKATLDPSHTFKSGVLNDLYGWETHYELQNIALNLRPVEFRQDRETMNGELIFLSLKTFKTLKIRNFKEPAKFFHYIDDKYEKVYTIYNNKVSGIIYDIDNSAFQQIYESKKNIDLSLFTEFYLPENKVKHYGLIGKRYNATQSLISDGLYLNCPKEFDYIFD